VRLLIRRQLYVTSLGSSYSHARLAGSYRLGRSAPPSQVSESYRGIRSREYDPNYANRSCHHRRAGLLMAAFNDLLLMSCTAVDLLLSLPPPTRCYRRHRRRQAACGLRGGHPGERGGVCSWPIWTTCCLLMCDAVASPLLLPPPLRPPTPPLSVGYGVLEKLRRSRTHAQSRGAAVDRGAA